MNLGVIRGVTTVELIDVITVKRRIVGGVNCAI